VEWVTADGKSEPLMSAIGEYGAPRLSPDGRRLALSVRGQSGWEVWIHELASGTLSRLSTSGEFPEWTPDGSRVLFRDLSAETALMWQTSNFAGTSEPIARRFGSERAVDISEGIVSPDGKTLLYVLRGDFYTMPLGRDTTPTTFLVSAANNRGPRFSPDGKWLAYHSAISGRLEVYVTPFPGPGPRHQVSNAGGSEPVWSRDGGRLYYRQGRGMVAATLQRAEPFAVLSRTILFEGDFVSNAGHAQFDVARDGRLVMLRGTGAPSTIAVVLNWRGEEGERR
jgi:eukaryotic-like serine/threonine-protein kinase